MRIKAAILLMLAASTCTLAVSKEREYSVICTVEQVMLFHDAIDNPPPDDTPGAMAVLGTVHESELKTGLPTKPLGPNADLQDVANSSARNLYGAQFTVDLSLGNIAPIPFGPRRLLVPPKNLPESSDYATVFSPRYILDFDTHYSAGYFDRMTHLFRGLLVIEPARIGRRNFEYMDLGEMLFGGCQSG